MIEHIFTSLRKLIQMIINFFSLLEKSYQKLGFHQVSKPSKTIKTTWRGASWFQIFFRIWKPDETLALIFEIVLENSGMLISSNRVISFHIKLMLKAHVVRC